MIKKIYEVSPLENRLKNIKILVLIIFMLWILDGALTGEIINLDTIEEIVKKLDIKIEIGRASEE